MDLTIDLEAQIGMNSKEKNEYGEYIYDVSRGFYYLSLLHSKSYEYKEKGYRKKRSKVIFIYKYDIEGDDWIQKIANINFSTKRVYDDMELYLVSLKKIPVLFAKKENLAAISLYKSLAFTELSDYIIAYF